MRRRFTNERVIYAVLSVVIATVMWLYVATAQNPLVERIMTLDLHVRGLPTAEAVVQAPNRVQVRLQGPRSALALLVPTLLDASVDLAGLRPGEHRVPVDVAAPPEVRVVERTPAEALVVLDALTRERLPVEVSLIGAPPQDVTLGAATTRPGHVTVSGAAVQVEEVRHAIVTLDTTRLRQQLVSSVPIHLVDANGQEVRGLSVDPPIVEVMLPVQEGTITKIVPVVPTLAGTTPAAFAVTGVTITPETAVLSGSANTLQAIQTAATAPIDIGAARSDVTRQVPLAVPAGVAASPREVTVVVHVGRALLARAFSAIPVRVVGIAPGWTARVVPDRVQVQVEGPQDAMERLATAAIVVQVDVTGMRAGPHRAAPQVVLPSGGVRVLLVTPAQVAVTLLPSR